MLARARRPETPAWWRRWVGTFEIALVLSLPRLCGACDDPPRFASMMVTSSVQPSYNPGDTVEYKCRPGYRKVLKKTIQTVCNDDGTWTALEEDACAKKTCSHPPVPNNGEIAEIKGSLEFGSEVRFACFEGFRLLGTKVIYCELSGDTVDWSEESPICQKILCAQPEKIQNGRYSNSHKDEFEYGEVVTYSCNPSTGSDDFSLIGMRQRVCSGNGEWTGTAPRCEVVKCPYPTVENGSPKSIIPKKRYYNTTVLFECLPGFTMKGAELIRCDEDSTWKPAVPQCLSGSKPTVNIPTPAARPPSSKPTVNIPTPAARPPSPSSETTTTTTTTSSTSAASTSRDPGYVSPTEQPPASPSSLGAGIIAVIVLGITIVLLLVAFAVYQYLQHKPKREGKSSEVSFSTYRSKSSSPAEESS